MPFVQQVDGVVVEPASLTVPTTAFNSTAGNPLICITAAPQGVLQQVSDNKLNAWMLGESITYSGFTFILWLSWNANGGSSHIVTLTVGTSSNPLVIYVAEYGELPGKYLVVTYAQQSQTNVGTTTDAVTSGTGNVDVQPALVFGFCATIADTACTAGTNFTGRTAVWDFGGGASARAEDRRVTTTANHAATFTNPSGLKNTVTFMLALREITPGTLIIQKNDTFGSPNDTTLSTHDSGWTQINGLLECKGSNQAGPGIIEGDAEDIDSICKRNDAFPGTDQWSEVQIDNLGSSGDYCGALTREGGTNGFNTLTHYAGGASDSGQLEFHRQVNGVNPGSIYISAAGVVSNGDKVGVVSVGKIHYLRHNQAEKVFREDATISNASTYGVGIYPGSLTDTARISNWSAGIVGANVAIEQEGYRWRLDDGDEANATWVANQDTSITSSLGAARRLRILVNTSGDANAAQYRLEYKEANATNWTVVS